MEEELSMTSLARAVSTEAFGAFALVVVTLTVVTIGPGVIPGALAYGFATAGLIAALGHVSGGHFNPAVTLAMLCAKQIDVLAAAAYWIAQFTGGAVGALVVMMAIDREVVAVGTPGVNDELTNVGGAVAAEAIATFALVLVMFCTVSDRRSPVSVYPMAAGLTVTAGFFAIAPLTGAAINPARGFGAAVVGGEWDGVAAWLAGPVVGALLAWLLYQFVLAPDDDSDHRPSSSTPSGRERTGRQSAASGPPLPPPPGSPLLP